MFYPTDIEGQVRNNGFYDPFPYRYWSYPKSSRNLYENSGSKMNQPAVVLQDAKIAGRILRPKLLCFLDERTSQNPRGCVDLKEWIRKHGDGQEPTYVFVSYTAEKQFGRRCKHAQLETQTNGHSLCNCTPFPVLSIERKMS
jgi:hypothetical protein